MLLNSFLVDIFFPSKMSKSRKETGIWNSGGKPSPLDGKSGAEMTKLAYIKEFTHDEGVTSPRYAIRKARLDHVRYTFFKRIDIN